MQEVDSVVDILSHPDATQILVPRVASWIIPDLTSAAVYVWTRNPLVEDA
jgi:hypothetical protein